MESAVLVTMEFLVVFRGDKHMRVDGLAGRNFTRATIVGVTQLHNFFMNTAPVGDQ